MDRIFLLQMTLKTITPPTWRKVNVPATFSFAELHNIVQVCFGWTSIFDHKFEAKIGVVNTTIMPLNGIDFGDDAKEEQNVTLQEVFFQIGAKGNHISNYFYRYKLFLNYVQN